MHYKASSIITFYSVLHYVLYNYVTSIVLLLVVKCVAAVSIFCCTAYVMSTDT